MKKLLLAIVCFSFISCESSSDHEVRYSPDGKDSVVYVNYRDDNGNMQNFWMNYMIFSMLMHQGGYGSVYNYYHSHPNPHYNPTIYQNYKTSSRTYSSPSRTYSPSIRSSTPSRSYFSPSRSQSTPSRSYSSPSRSYSSPSRSYSSPSRSYSSPSRSYSSPSHH